jgi:metallo-beta-lactamase family protein
VLLTHAHIDHSGLLPKLVKAGYRAKIFSTDPTMDLASIMLPDSGHIQEIEVEQFNRRALRKGGKPVDPIYTMEDAEAALKLFRAVPYDHWVDVADGMRARFWDAGHLLGSASIEVEIDEGGAKPLRLLFSGDIGSNAKLFHGHPQGPSDIDHLIVESTYGDREREDATLDARRDALCAEIRYASEKRGALIIPSFAVERTQELLVDLVALMDSGNCIKAPIFIDSPLASRATDVFASHADDVEHGAELKHAMRHEMVRFTESVDDSKSIGRFKGFHIVIAASGMCEAGRIRHHLRNWLWRREATVLLVGFQAQGTLGRILQEGAERVRIMGDEIEVKARIRSLDVYSGHADRGELVDWVKARQPIRGKVFLVHGEDPALVGFEQALTPLVRDGQIERPELDSVYELDATDARAVSGLMPRRLEPEKLGRVDWHNDLSRFILDMGEKLRLEADEKGRAKLIRKLRRALDEAEAVDNGKGR